MSNLKFTTRYKEVWERLVGLSIAHLKKNKLFTQVLGISGGVDSALIAALGHEVRRQSSIPLMGVVLPLLGNKEDEMTRAYQVTNAFCDFDLNINMNPALEAVYDVLNLTHLTPGKVEVARPIMDIEKIRGGNAQARLRMIMLFDIAKLSHGLVLSTDNYTEYLLGFWTLHGDVGNFAPIQMLWKTEVYGLSDWLVEQYGKKAENSKRAEALQACIDAVPTDGLGISDSDLDQINPGGGEGKTSRELYQEVDEILMQFCLGNGPSAPHPVIQRHRESEFKRQDPVCLSRNTIVPSE